jgi:cation diffusion facilitator family transporter
MDCPSEEQLIRTALAPVEGVEGMEFDIPARKLVVWHRGEVEPVRGALERLDLKARLVTSELSDEALPDAAHESAEGGALRLLLIINATMFVVEMVAGWIGESTGLLSDSLDMLADAIVYGVALWAVGRAASSQRLAASISGWFQMTLALGVLFEVGRRFAYGSDPEAPIIMGTALVALVANVASVAILHRHREGGVHMKASWIFSTNDVIANLGVIAAGGLVAWSGSQIPDLVAGTAIGLLVMRGAVRILRLARDEAG